MDPHRHEDGVVVLGVDAHPADIRDALAFAVAEAGRRRVALRLVHGCSPLPMPTTLEPGTPLEDRESYWMKRLDLVAEAAVELAGAPLTVDVRIDPGTGVHALVEESARASLVIVQARAASTVRRIATGSTSTMVAARSLAPTAIIPARYLQSQTRAGVVVGVDASGSSPAVEAAFREAELRHTSVTAVRAWNGHGGQGEPPWRPLDTDEFQAEHDKLYEDLVTAVRCWTLSYPNVPTHCELHNLPPAEALVTAARNAQLLVVGRHHHGHLMPRALGHTVRRCLARSSCPVVITPERSAPCQSRVDGSKASRSEPAPSPNGR
jgi:nucleotide-binding universal stress UspA family protein